jgi:hypothetical protein
LINFERVASVKKLLVTLPVLVLAANALAKRYAANIIVAMLAILVLLPFVIAYRARRVDAGAR